jgi:NodT family efflux transporter outer membrane factor (OMF) lipoprotein
MSAALRAPGMRGLLLAAAVTVVAGCAPVGPDYVRPSVATPAAFKEAKSQPAQSTAVAPASDRWWEIYGDPVLNGLVARVAVDNQSLAAAAARMREAQLLVKSAQGAAYPSVSLGSFKSGQRNENDYGLGASWELDLWGRIRRDVEAHRASAEASKDDLAAATLSMQAQVVQSYFALRQDDAAIALLQHAADVSGQWHRMVGNQYTQGQASSGDVSQALVRLSTVQLQLADTRSSRAQLEHAIAVMLGKPPADFAIEAAPFDARVPEVPAGVPAILLERRPDVAASERRMAAANARIGVAKAETLPSISLAAGIGVRHGPTGTADVRAPLFEGGRLEAQVQSAGEGYNEAVANYRQTVLDAYREVEDGLATTNELAGAAELHAKAAAAAAESDRVTQNQYREGVADYPAVVEATNGALDAGRGELQLRLRRLDASVSLIVALGGGWKAEPAQEQAQAPAQP